MDDSEKDKIHQNLLETVKKLVGFMNLDCQVEIKEQTNTEGRSLFVSIYAPDNVRFLIGKNGQNLKALEHLVRLISLKDIKDIPYQNITVDANDYRKARAQEVLELAKQAVGRVRNNQKAEALYPMSSYERRVVHMELAAYPDIVTESIGEEPQRRVVIKPFP